MANAKYKELLEKSISSAISAIEIYNKPDFKYREESFSILIINAWELLIKAKILKDNSGNMRSIYVQNKKKTLKGETPKRFYAKLNRCGNPLTLEINGALEKVNLPKILKENIKLLIEIRDNSIHFINKDKFLKKKILEIGTANLKSFVKLSNDWFDYDLSKYNFYLMPISFFHSFEVESFSINKNPVQIRNLIKHILQKEKENPSDTKKEHNISLVLETKFAKSSNEEAFIVKYDPNADISVKIDTEEKFGKQYPLDFAELVEKMKEKYYFSLNNDFYKIKRALESNPKYCGKRFLNFREKRGTSKKYYSYEIFKEFDKHYERKVKK